jgi:hypothetical protein
MQSRRLPRQGLFFYTPSCTVKEPPLSLFFAPRARSEKIPFMPKNPPDVQESMRTGPPVKCGAIRSSSRRWFCSPLHLLLECTAVPAQRPSRPVAQRGMPLTVLGWGLQREPEPEPRQRFGHRGGEGSARMRRRITRCGSTFMAGCSEHIHFGEAFGQSDGAGSISIIIRVYAGI